MAYPHNNNLVHLDTIWLNSKVMVIDQCSRSQEENVAKVAGATLSDGFLVKWTERTVLPHFHSPPTCSSAVKILWTVYVSLYITLH